MTTFQLTILALIGSAGLHAAIAVFLYGRMTERVANHSRWLTDLEEKVSDHAERISRLEGQESGANVSR